MTQNQDIAPTASNEQGVGTPSELPDGQAVKLDDEQLKQVADQVWLQAQSYVDRRDRERDERVNQRFEQLESLWKQQEDLGHPVPPDVKERMKNQAVQDAIRTQPQTGKPEVANQQPPQQQPQDPINQAAFEMMQKAGVQILPNDPETQQLDFSSPGAYLSSMSEALNAKKARLGQAPQQPAQPQQPMNPAARLGGLGAGGSAQPDLQSQFNRELEAIRSSPFGSSEQVRQLRRKYRKLGLDL